MAKKENDYFGQVKGNLLKKLITVYKESEQERQAHLPITRIICCPLWLIELLEISLTAQRFAKGKANHFPHIILLQVIWAKDLIITRKSN